ncbi:hypothetical protein GC163_14700 [bacterium]|nr:hypothetical protein [bacterium]
MRRVWKAPHSHGGAVIDPPWDALPQVIEANQQLWNRSEVSITEIDWLSWRQRCRDACLVAARDYTSGHLNFTIPERMTGPLIVGGHQPELFHPGVWAKNFALSRLAERVRGVGLNLIIDSDASAAASIVVPSGTVEEPQRSLVPYDAARPMQPWETAAIVDRELFSTFGDRVAEAMRAWKISPILPTAWPAAVDQVDRTGKLSDALTAARAFQERQWGIANLELPMSRVCSLAPFTEFVSWILLRLPEFVRQHNEVLNEYRQLNRIRSHSHPVADLAQQEDWWEAPFWIWRDAAVLRDRLFVKRQGEELILRDRIGEFLRAPAEPAALAAALSELPSQQIQLRTRALTTTLFARLGLADLFVHGLGGAKYDEMTDALMVRFFHVDAPRFLTVSATLHLPVPIPVVMTAEQRGQLRHQLNDMAYNPQRYLPLSDGSVQRLIDDRVQLLNQLHGASSPSGTRRERRSWYLRLLEIRRLLQAQLSPAMLALEQRWQAREQSAQAAAILGSREYSWGLFPAKTLREVYTNLFA